MPLYDDRRLFELLILEGAQAGLSWSTVLRRRGGYRRAFAGFDPRRVASFSTVDQRRLLRDPGIIRHAGKIRSAVTNARAYLAVQREHGSFAAYLWGFVGRRPIQGRRRSPAEVPAETTVSRGLSRDLKRRGFTFVGPTICYAFMQAAGLANDHLSSCFRCAPVRRQGQRGRAPKATSALRSPRRRT